MEKQNSNISAGTQVVALVEVRGTNHSLVHPRGAVGVVTRTPTGDQHHLIPPQPGATAIELREDKPGTSPVGTIYL